LSEADPFRRREDDLQANRRSLVLASDISDVD